MRVLFAAAEAAPIVKVGGLGDVAGSLPPALKRLGVDIRVAIPWYPDIDVAKWQIREHDGIGETRLGDSGIPVYLFAREVFEETGKHKAILGTQEEERWFGRFCDAILDFIRKSEWKPQVFHGNDWHVSQALEHFEKASPQELEGWGYQTPNLATLLTIHNLSYHTRVLRRAVLSADLINAVSPTYAKEILTKEFCEGLCAELTAREADLSGVLNGIDYSIWDPRSDALLSFPYDPNTWRDDKARNKTDLRKALGFSEGEKMLLGFVGRLDPHQKGVLILANAIDKLVGMGCQIVVLGSGSIRAERSFRRASSKFPGEAKAILKYDEALAHRIYAGADALLIPSRFEPCGLIQMIAMRYGSLPIAHAVGGLVDTIRDGESGFLYSDYSSHGLVEAVARAKSLFTEQAERWAALVEVAMAEDFSWNRSAEEYRALYERALVMSSR